MGNDLYIAEEDGIYEIRTSYSRTVLLALPAGGLFLLNGIWRCGTVL